MSPKFDVCTMSDNEGCNLTSAVCPKSTIRSLKTDVWGPQSEVWWSLTKSEVWCPMSVRKLSELCPKSEVLESMYVCLKPGVQKKPKSEVQNASLKPKSEVRQLSETEVQSLMPEIWSWKSEVESLSEVRSKFFAIIITLSYNTGIIYCVCRSIMTIKSRV